MEVENIVCHDKLACKAADKQREEFILGETRVNHGIKPIEFSPVCGPLLVFHSSHGKIFSRAVVRKRTIMAIRPTATGATHL